MKIAPTHLTDLVNIPASILKLQRIQIFVNNRTYYHQKELFLTLMEIKFHGSTMKSTKIGIQ